MGVRNGLKVGSCGFEWNATILFFRQRRISALPRLLTSVIKAKRNEFWVWAEAGRLYQSNSLRCLYCHTFVARWNVLLNVSSW